jgi:hypothetical protein
VNKPKTFIIILAVVIFIIIGIVVYAILRKRSVDIKVKMISDAIDQGVGTLGTDIDSLLVSTKSDPSYVLSSADLSKLKSAKGSWYSTDHPEYITQVLGGKTKAQIKAIVTQFQNSTGIKFNDHLNDIFSDVTGYDTAGYNSVLNIVKSAK